MQGNDAVPGSAATTEAPAGASGSDGTQAQAAVLRRLNAEHLLALAAGLLVLVVHDVAYLLSQPFWVDEAWVAVTTRFPLSQLPATTSVTPIGWSVLLRVVTISGEQTSRLLPLAFAGAAVFVAYWFGRRLGWQSDASVAAGLLAAAAALLVPAMLVRDDLKQYTADACLALVVLALTSRLERGWSRSSLIGLSVAVWGGMLFSDAAAFVGAAAFGALCVVQIASRAWRRLAEAALVGAATGVLSLAVYEAFDARGVVSGVTSYWAGFYVPISGGPHAALTFISSHFDAVARYFGLGPWWLAVPLVAAGLITIFALGRPATAIAIVVLWPEMLVLSSMKKYPFLDLRTSTFLFAVTAVVAAVGVVGLCTLLRSVLRSLTRPWLPTALAAGLAAVALAAFASQAQPYVRSHQIPNEDVRDQARYVAGHAARDDVILVNMSSNWGFAYYWPGGQPSRRSDPAVLQGYEAYFPGQPRIVVARNRDLAAVDAALSQAVTTARQHGCTRIWLVRTHVDAAEGRAWGQALARQGLSAHQVGDDGLSVIRTAGVGCK